MATDCVMEFFKDYRNRTMNKINWQYSIAFMKYCLMEYSMVIPKKCSLELFKNRILWILNIVCLLKYSISIQQKISMEWSFLKGKCSVSSTPFCKYCAMEHSIHLQKKKRTTWSFLIILTLSTPYSLINVVLWSTPS